MTITAAQFRAYFDREQFAYGESLPAVRDKDIDAAVLEAAAVFNDGLYPEAGVRTMAFLYLTAHFLQSDMDGADGQTKLLQSSRSADGVSESLSIPEWMTKGEIAAYSTTYWGQKWLLLSKPYLDGVVIVVPGLTLP